MAQRKARKAAAKRPAATRAGAKKPAAKARAAKAPAPRRPAARKAPAKKAAFGRPGTAGKADGDAPVRAYLEALPPARREVAQRLDALIGETVPDVRRGLKWSMPTYGRKGLGWFASVGAFKDYVALAFFRGARLDPPPPLGDAKEMRRVNIPDMAAFDEARLRAWIRQASSMPGWGKVP